MAIGETISRIVRQASEPLPPRVRAAVRVFARDLRPIGFLAYIWQRFEHDDGLRLAAGLSYASLLALVPLLAIVIGVVSAFPAFEGVQDAIMDLVLEDFLPETEAAIAARVEQFVNVASALTGPGVVALAVMAILLLANINGALNKIWRVSDPRPWTTRILVYWALLTLGPMLLAASLSLSSDAVMPDTKVWFEGIPLTRIIGYVLLIASFTLIFMVVPNRRVEAPHAIVGATVTAILFELLNYFFGLYLAYFPTYQIIYGAFSAVPIFLLWLFLCWTVVLLGAEIAAAIPEWRAAVARGHTTYGAGARLALALTVLSRLRKASQDGRQLKRQEMVRALPATPEEVDNTLKPLREAGFLVRAQNGRWILGRDLSGCTLDELLALLDLSLAPGEGWPSGVIGVVKDVQTEGSDCARRSLEDLLERRHASTADVGAREEWAKELRR